MIIVRRAKQCIQQQVDTCAASDTPTARELSFLLPQLAALELDPGLSFQELYHLPPGSGLAHIYLLLPQLSSLITHPDGELRENVAVLIGLIAKQFSQSHLG